MPSRKQVVGPRFVRLAAVVLFVASFLRPASASACGNAVMSEDEHVRLVKRAEGALEAGDLAMARSLATEALEADPWTGSGESGGEGGLSDRAGAIRALSFVRDRRATTAEKLEALEVLAVRIAERRRRDREVGPELRGDYGEALESLGRDADAVDELAPLVDRDLLGSPHALAAFGRAAQRTGRAALAATAFDRCRTIAGASGAGVCEGRAPRAPLFRGGAVPYAVPASVLAAWLLASLLLLRRGRRPWIGHRRNASAIAVALASLLAFLLAREVWSPAGPTLLLSVVLVAVSLLRRASFVRAVKEGVVDGFHFRSAAPADAALPRLRLFGGPREEITLERLPVAGYREAARVAVLRLGRSVVRPWHLAAAFAVTAVLLLFASGFFFLARSEARVSAISVAPPAPEATEAAEPNPSNLVEGDAARTP